MQKGFSTSGAKEISLKGKTTIIKSLILPKFLYPMSALPVPTRALQEIDTMIRKFLWNNKKAKVKKSVMIQRIEKGGIKFPDIYLVMKASKIRWIQRLLTTPGKW